LQFMTNVAEKKTKARKGRGERSCPAEGGGKGFVRNGAKKMVGMQGRREGGKWERSEKKISLDSVVPSAELHKKRRYYK